MTLRSLLRKFSRWLREPEDVLTASTLSSVRAQADRAELLASLETRGAHTAKPKPAPEPTPRDALSKAWHDKERA